MERMTSDALHDRVATALTKRLLRPDGLIENGEELADIALATLGLDDGFLTAVADLRLSDELIGNRLRARWVGPNRSATEGPQDGR